MILGKKMATAMTKALHSDGFNLVQNNGEAAGQTVFHFHMHLIPRYEGDNAGIAAWKQGTLEDAVKEQIIKSVTAELKAEKRLAAARKRINDRRTGAENNGQK